MNALPLVEGAVAVIERDGAVLLSRRPEGKHLAGCWEFPGGRMEPGEGPEACAAREAREELGIEVCVREPLITLDHAYPEKRVRLHCFRCDLVSGEPRALASAEVRWVPRAGLRELRLPPADGPLVELLAVAGGGP